MILFSRRLVDARQVLDDDPGPRKGEVAGVAPGVLLGPARRESLERRALLRDLLRRGVGLAALPPLIRPAVCG